MGTSWSLGSSVWTGGRTSSLWGWQNTGKGCPGKLWSLLLWGYSRPAWSQPCAACCRWPCFSRRVGLDDPQRSLPTLNILWFCDSMKKSRALALDKNFDRRYSLVIFLNTHPLSLHSKLQTFCDENYPETVKISIYGLKNPFITENTEVVWWSIVFSKEGFGFCCLFLKVFCIREAVSAEDRSNVSPGLSMSNQLPMRGRTQRLITELLSQMIARPISRY